MADHYVICINKHPSHMDAHCRIEVIGTNETRDAKAYSHLWTIQEVIDAIENESDKFYCDDTAGDLARCIVALHDGHKYVKTVPDGIQPDNLLAKPECDLS